MIDVEYSLDNNYFEVIDSERKAYWLGFIYADGNIYRNRLAIELALIDINHLKKFRNDIKSNHPITCRANKKRDTCIISINNEKLCNDLRKIGCVSNKTNNGFIDLLKLPYQKLKLAFLRGYLDGNGFIEKNDITKYRVVFTLKSQQLMSNINSMLEELGLYTKIYDYITYYRINVERKEDFLRLLNLLYTNANVYLDRKYEIFLKRTMPFDQEIDQIISARLSWEVLPNMYEPFGHVLG